MTKYRGIVPIRQIYSTFIRRAHRSLILSPHVDLYFRPENRSLFKRRKKRRYPLQWHIHRMLQAPFFLNCACLIKFIYVCFLCMACVVSCNSHSFFRLPACLLALYTFISCFDSQLQPPKCQVFFLVEQHLLNLDKFVLYPQTFYNVKFTYWFWVCSVKLSTWFGFEYQSRNKWTFFPLLIFWYDDKGQTLFRSSCFFRIWVSFTVTLPICATFSSNPQ